MNKIICISIPVLVIIFATHSSAFSQSQPTDTTKTNIITVVDAKDQILEILPFAAGDKIKNVILIIGDGMGISQITAAQYGIVGTGGVLSMQTMPVTGFVKTYSSDNLITDSAAGATAFSCGLKTYNGAIGMTHNKKKCKTILELAHEKGLSTGLVSTSSVTHATPASFASHVEHRRMQNIIAAQYLDSGVDVILGGGLKFFDADQRSDSLDLLSKFVSNGYQVMKHVDELADINSQRVLGLFADEGLLRSENEPSIAEMTEVALHNLNQNSDGFFLMVEGSQIDWAGHNNDVAYLLREMADFDEAVSIALEFAQSDGETLVILTADHETGGMTLQGQTKDNQDMEIYWTTDYHTGSPVPLMAYGPGALEFMGWRENTYVGKKIAELLGLGEFPVIVE